MRLNLDLVSRGGTRDRVLVLCFRVLFSTPDFLQLAVFTMSLLIKATANLAPIVSIIDGLPEATVNYSVILVPSILS